MQSASFYADDDGNLSLIADTSADGFLKDNPTARKVRRVQTADGGFRYFRDDAKADDFVASNEGAADASQGFLDDDGGVRGMDAEDYGAAKKSWLRQEEGRFAEGARRDSVAGKTLKNIGKTVLDAAMSAVGKVVGPVGAAIGKSDRAAEGANDGHGRSRCGACAFLPEALEGSRLFGSTCRRSARRRSDALGDGSEVRSDTTAQARCQSVGGLLL